MTYRRGIREEAARQGRLGANPRHIEAWMRLANYTLDSIGPQQWRQEVATALACMDATTEAESEQLADSLGIFKGEA